MLANHNEIVGLDYLLSNTLFDQFGDEGEFLPSPQVGYSFGLEAFDPRQYVKVAGERTLYDVIEEYGSGLVINANKLKQIINFYHRFMQANDNHIAFFSGNLVGVYEIIWHHSNRDEFVEEICEIIDFGSLQEDFRKVDGIEAARQVSGNPLNHLFLWLAHRIHIAKGISDEHKRRGIVAVLNILQCKYLTSLHVSYFPHRADPSVAQAAFESLSKKSLIKQLGSWRKVIEYRSENLYSPRSPMHWIAITQFPNTRISVLFVNDVQNRVRKSLINLTRAFHDIRQREAKLLSTTVFSTIDGEKVLRDVRNTAATHRRIILDILTKHEDFIRSELIGDTLAVVPTASETNIRKTLEFIFNHAGGSRKQYDISVEIQDLVVHIYDFIRLTKTPSSDIGTIVGLLRSSYRAHRTTAPAVVKLKMTLDIILNKALTTNHEATKSATKVAVMVYLTLRILSIPYYNKV